MAWEASLITAKNKTNALPLIDTNNLITIILHFRPLSKNKVLKL